MSLICLPSTGMVQRGVRLSVALGISPFLHPRLHSSIQQQTDCSEDEHKHHNLILPAVTLETLCEDVRFFGVLADGQVVAQAKPLRAVVTRARLGFGALERGVVQRDDGAVRETGAFAEG